MLALKIKVCDTVFLVLTTQLRHFVVSQINL